VPKLERHIGGSEIDLDDVVDAVVLWAFVPPVSVLELEGAQWQGGEVGLNFADHAACYEGQ